MIYNRCLRHFFNIVRLFELFPELLITRAPSKLLVKHIKQAFQSRSKLPAHFPDRILNRTVGHRYASLYDATKALQSLEKYDEALMHESVQTQTVRWDCSATLFSASKSDVSVPPCAVAASRILRILLVSPRNSIAVYKVDFKNFCKNLYAIPDNPDTPWVLDEAALDNLLSKLMEQIATRPVPFNKTRMELINERQSADIEPVRIVCISNWRDLSFSQREQIALIVSSDSAARNGIHFYICSDDSGMNEYYIFDTLIGKEDNFEEPVWPKSISHVNVTATSDVFSPDEAAIIHQMFARYLPCSPAVVKQSPSSQTGGTFKAAGGAPAPSLKTETEELTPETLVQAALQKSSQARDLGEESVTSIVNYYLDEKYCDPVYDPEWFKGWKRYNSSNEAYAGCGIDYAAIRAQVCQRSSKLLKKGESLASYKQKIAARILETAQDMLSEGYHVIDLPDCSLLVKSRAEDA